MRIVKDKINVYRFELFEEEMNFLMTLVKISSDNLEHQVKEKESSGAQDYTRYKYLWEDAKTFYNRLDEVYNDNSHTTAQEKATENVHSEN